MKAARHEGEAAGPGEGGRDRESDPLEVVLCIGAGPRAVLSALDAELAAHGRAVRADPSRLARPLRIVVPSRPLRRQVAARVVAAGRPQLGVGVHTLHGLALEILARCNLALRDGPLLFPILARRLARAEPALRAVLEPLQDGYAVAAQSAADLLDAGLLPGHREGLEERLGEALPAGEAARASALLRVALGAPPALAELGLVHRSALFRAARDALEERPERLPTARVLVLGYADATGVQADLLEALLRAFGGAALLDEPPDPARPESEGEGEAEAEAGRPRAAPGGAFAARLRTRLEACAHRSERAPAAPPAALEAFAAPGAQMEAREVAERVAELLDGGAEPSRIGVVARDWEEHADALAVHLERLAVPFAMGEAVPSRLGPAGQPARALLDLLAGGPEAPSDRWLDAFAGVRGLRGRDLRLAVHALGAARLDALAALDLEGLGLGAGGRLPLPVRRGLREEEDEEPGAGSSGADAPAQQGAAGPGPADPSRAPLPARRLARRRSLPREEIETLREAARAWLEGLAAWPDPAPLADHVAHLRRLLQEVLGWDSRMPGAAPLLDRLGRLAEELGADCVLEREELRLLLERRTRDLGRSPRGAAAAGVQVLTVMEARGLVFDHLFVLGLNRDRFPRPATPDPLLRDAARRRLEELLPDVPVKARAFDEERYLFASLCAAAPRVVLSWQVVSDDGRERPPSPLVERLRLEGALPEAPTVPGLYDPRRSRPRPAFEHAVQGALEGSPAAARPALVAALGLEAPRGEAVATARLAAVAELEGRGGDLGPFLGALGGSLAVREAPPVTFLEALARCPWRAFLERVLRLEPLPDARSALPGLDPARIGQVVHGVLERIVRRAGAPADAALDPGAPTVRVAWPDPAAFEALLAEVAEETARESGAGLPGFARALAARARPHLERAREIEWPAGVRRGVLGAELRGTARVETARGARRVTFRADRVDRIVAASAAPDEAPPELAEAEEPGDGGPSVLRLLDYKTGRPPGRDLDAWRGLLERGLWLQGMAYAHVETDAEAGAPPRGGYVFCRATRDETLPDTLEAERDQAGLAAAFADSVGVLFEALERGVLPPRLVHPDGRTPRECEEYCAVRDACLQFDTTARWRVRRMHLESPHPEEGGSADGRAEALLARRLLAMGPDR